MSNNSVLLRILMCSILVILITEVVLRLFFINPSRQLFDEELGWQYMPESTLIYTSEGYGIHRLNELGLNDESFLDKKNKEKIFVLGDSFTEALEVSRERNFVSLLTKKLPKFDFINAGRGAYSPVHQLVVSKRLISYAKPEKILLILSHGDTTDLINTPVDISRKDGDIMTVQPRSIERFKIKEKFRFVLHNSALATYLMRRYAVSLKKILSFFKGSAKKNSENIIVLEANEKKERLEKYQVELLSHIFTVLNSIAPTTVFYIPNVIYKEKGGFEISEFSKHEIILMKETAKRSNISFYDLNLALNQDYIKTGRAAFGFHNTKIGGEGHLNSVGHEIVASFIFDQVGTVK